MFGEDTAAVVILLHLPKTSKPGTLKAEVDTTDP